MNFVLVLALLPIAAGLLLASWVAISRRPRRIDAPARDLVIIAAHPDDCVIMAGGYAMDAVRQDKRVAVYYLTRGASGDEPTRAQVRRAEAIAAWGQVGVPAHALVFGELSEQEPDETAVRGDTEVARARADIEQQVRAAPRSAALFVPAAWEEHVDHRLARRLALEAVLATGRRDLQVLECAAYNEYVSFVQAPARALREALAAVPGVGGWLRRTAHPWAGFASGPRPWELPRDRDRDRRRRELLRVFASEHGELLVRLFGGCERYRPIHDIARALAEPPPSGYLRMGGCSWSVSALVVLAGVMSAVALVVGTLGHSIAVAMGRPGVAALLLAAGVVASAGVLRRGLSRPARLVHASAALAMGGVAALLA